MDDEFFRALVQQQRDCIVTIDGGSTVRFANDAVEDVFGYPSEAVVGEPLTMLMPERLHDGHREGIKRYLETGERTFDWDDIEVPGLHRDGHEMQLSVRFHEHGTDGNGDRLFSGIIRDITERKERERELERRSAAIEEAGDGIAILDNDGTYEYVNDAHAAVYRYDDPGEMVGMSWPRLYDDEEVERFEAEIMPALKEEGHWRGDALGQRVGGERFPQELSLTTLDSGGMVCVVRDVTDRKDYERTLETLQRTVRDLLDTEDSEEIAEVGIEAAADVLDLPISAVYLRDGNETALEPVAWTDAATETLDDLPRFEPGNSLAWEAYESGEQRRYEHPGAEPGVYNTDTPVEEEAIVPLGEHGVLLVAVTETRDIDSEARYLLDLLGASLETALDRAEWAAELRAQNEQLERFAGVLSHDLRDPLNTANATLNLARNECDSDYLDDLEELHDRMETLIENVLALAREGREVGEREPVDLGGVVADAWETTGAESVTLADDDLGTIEADPDRLQQLLENLFGNAVRHAGEDIEVTVGRLPDGFYVADDGDGIPEDIRDRVFEFGFSGADGTGLGLGIVRSIAEAHGWTGELTESADGGARFEFSGVDWLDDPGGGSR